MKVQEVLINGKKRYLLIDGDNKPVVPVLSFLKYLDNIGKAENTLKSYCHYLKFYFQFLDEKEIGYKEVNLDLLAEYISWLRNPCQSTKVVQLQQTKARRSERTVNTMITCVQSFYDYLMRIEDYEKDLSEKTKKQVAGNHRSFKPFLHHVSKGKYFDKNILKIREPRREILTLTNNQVQSVHDACSNIRDALLIRVLYEGGLRIGEALSLWIEDFDIGSTSIQVRESKSVSGKGRRVYVSGDTMNVFQDYLIEYHDADTNYVFINLSGPNKGNPLNYQAAFDVIKRIRKKTQIDITPHMLRHTYATELHEQGVEVSIIQKLLGHAQVQTTIQTYVHPTDETIRKEWQKAHKNMKDDKLK
ncbi:tyrosine-type recombinase/integrase [Bacillus sp. AFS041924]|uniref:tyrosine-type recombinase/integrase n=1 Tax=Bacillus sp. AFS041924 TaxID=2033503 RepID=UPI000BFBAC76|nr:tyrosine-type recombinase/integrase [Bacillus sp. AFS041924]PGS46043.1 transposase [Bacillus sp. AFS041924]